MNFRHDLSEFAKKELNNSGVTVSEDWDEHLICINYLELNQRWFNRNIPYMVVYSKELLAKIPTLRREEQNAIKEIENCFKQCKPITPYMSKLIRKTNIKSSDFLLKNWGIYHVHLEKLSLLKVRFTMPNLLFFQAKGRVVHFIDIKPHPKGETWFDRDLLEIIYSNWPWLLIFLNGVKPIQKIPDNKVHGLTKRMGTILDFHGGAIMPSNFGVVTSGNSMMAVMETNKIFNFLKNKELELTQNEEKIKRRILKEKGINITESLDYELLIESGYFIAYEKHSNYKISLL